MTLTGGVVASVGNIILQRATATEAITLGATTPGLSLTQAELVYLPGRSGGDGYLPPNSLPGPSVAAVRSSSRVLVPASPGHQRNRSIGRMDNILRFRLALAAIGISLVSGCGGIATSAPAEPTSSSIPTTPTAKAYGTPPGRMNPAMAYDPDTHEVLMYGGLRAQGSSVNDMWAWDGRGWYKLSPKTMPEPYPSGMAYDPKTRQMVVITVVNNSNLGLDRTKLD